VTKYANHAHRSVMGEFEWFSVKFRDKRMKNV